MLHKQIFQCPECNSKMIDESDYNDEGRYTHIQRVCPYCGIKCYSQLGGPLDPLIWESADGMLYDPNRHTKYLLDEDTDDGDIPCLLPANPIEDTDIH